MSKSSYNVRCGQLDIKSNLVSKHPNLKLFKIKLSDFVQMIPNLVEFLSSDEVERADRYHFLKDKNRFIICRGLLRFLLSNQLEITPSKIEFKKDKNKKPYLSHQKPIHFNVSHSENYALIAIGDVSVGVDVEYVSKDFDFTDILNHVFSDSEKYTIENSTNKRRTFYNLWTRKEAFVKATGKGISDCFAQIPSLDDYHLISQELLGDYQKIDVSGFDLDEDYVAALAFDAERLTPDHISIYSLPTTYDELLQFQTS